MWCVPTDSSLLLYWKTSEFSLLPYLLDLTWPQVFLWEYWRGLGPHAACFLTITHTNTHCCFAGELCITTIDYFHLIWICMLLCLASDSWHLLLGLIIFYKFISYIICQQSYRIGSHTCWVCGHHAMMIELPKLAAASNPRLSHLWANLWTCLEKILSSMPWFCDRIWVLASVELMWSASVLLAFCCGVGARIRINTI